MYVQLTIVVLGLLTGAMLVLRFFWWRLPDRLRTALLAIASVSVTLPVISLVSRWSTTSDRANTLLHWTAMVGYELILMRFSLLRPQWLSSFCAVVLLVPAFGSSLLLPLADIFDPKRSDVFEIGKAYLCERRPWDPIRGETPGFSLSVYYRPRIASFLRHRVQLSAFNTEECEASASTAWILSGSREVLFYCPAKPGQRPVEHILPLD